MNKLTNTYTQPHQAIVKEREAAGLFDDHDEGGAEQVLDAAEAEEMIVMDACDELMGDEEDDEEDDGEDRMGYYVVDICVRARAEGSEQQDENTTDTPKIRTA